MKPKSEDKTKIKQNQGQSQVGNLFSVQKMYILLVDGKIFLFQSRAYYYIINCIMSFFV